MVEFLRFFGISTRVRWADPHGAGPLGYVLIAILIAVASVALAGIRYRRRSRALRGAALALGWAAALGVAAGGFVRLRLDLANAIAGTAEFVLTSGGELLVLGPGVPAPAPGGAIGLVRSPSMSRGELMGWLDAGNRLVVARSTLLDPLIAKRQLWVVWRGAGLVVASREPLPYWRHPTLTWAGPTDAELLWETPDDEVGIAWIQPRGGPRRVFSEIGEHSVHRLHLTDLEPSTIYRFALVSPSAPGEGHGSFRTLPASDSPNALRFAVIGDTGGGRAVTAELIERITEFEPDLILHVGDLAYDRATIASLESQFYDPFRDLAGHVPLWIVPGNHDILDGGRDVALFLGLDPGSDLAVHYQRLLRSAGVVIASVNSNAPPLPFGATRRGFRAAMRENATDTWWRIAFFHHPPFAAEGKDRNQLTYAVLHPLLVASHVDVAFAGHSHNYQRSRPLGLWGPDPSGVRYVVSGGGGGTLREPNPSPDLEFRAEAHNFLRVVAREGRLWIEALDDNGALLDHILLERDRPSEAAREEPWTDPPRGRVIESGAPPPR